MDPNREKDTAVEKCDVSIEDGEEKTKSRFIIKITCRHGMPLPLQRYILLRKSRRPQDLPFDIRVYRTNACSLRQRDCKKCLVNLV